MLPAQLAAGVLFLAVLPSTVQSSIAFTSIARGNVAAAICSASLSNLAGIVLTPLLVALLLSGNGAGVDGSAVLGIVLQLLAPFVAGQLARRWIGAWITRNSAPLKLFDRGSILLVVYTAFSAGMTEGIWHRLDVVHLLVLAGVCVRAPGGGAGARPAGAPACWASPAPTGSRSCSAGRRRAWPAACRWRRCCSGTRRSG